MNIIDYGFFKAVVEADTPDNPGPHMLCFANEKGEDWYTIRRGLTEWEINSGRFISAIFPTWAMVDADGIVTNVEYDPSRLMPGDRRVLGIDAPIEQVKPGMIYRDGDLHPAEEPPP